MAEGAIRRWQEALPRDGLRVDFYALIAALGSGLTPVSLRGPTLVDRNRPEDSRRVLWPNLTEA